MEHGEMMIDSLRLIDVKSCWYPGDDGTQLVHMTCGVFAHDAWDRNLAQEMTVLSWCTYPVVYLFPMLGIAVEDADWVLSW